MVAIVGGVNDQWPLFCSAIEKVELIDDPRYVDGHSRTLNYEALIPVLQEAISGNTAEHWLKTFSDLGIACGPVNTIHRVVDDPQIKHRNTIVTVPHKRIEPVPVVNTPFKFSRTSPDGLGPAPDLGEHTEEVLVNIAKYSLEKIHDLIENGVIDSDYSE